MTWKNIDLHGANFVSKIVGEYEIETTKIRPVSKFKIRVLERENGFVAFPNVRVRTDDGALDGTSGFGSTEVEALQSAIKSVMEMLKAKVVWSEEELGWSDPRDY